MKLYFLIIILILCTVASTAYLHEQGELLTIRTNRMKTVHDAVHEYLPDLSHHGHLYNWLLLVFASPFIWNLGKYNLREISSALAWLIVPLFIVRSFFICASVTTKTTHVPRDWGGILTQCLFGHDFDYLYSGHIATSLVCVLIAARFKLINHISFWLILVLLYGFFSSMSRMHYSQDILVAFLAVPLFYDWVFCESGSKRLIWDNCPKRAKK